jgi:transcription initiation factor TFIID subunit TAF12
MFVYCSTYGDENGNKNKQQQQQQQQLQQQQQQQKDPFFHLTLTFPPRLYK